MFYLERFGTVNLPLLEARQDISSGVSLSPFRQLQGGGGFRVRGTERSPRGLTRITTTGEFVEDEPIDIEQLAYDLYAMRGTLDKLYRRTKGSEVVHWCWAELIRIGAENTADTFLVQPVAPEFQMISPCWYGNHHSGETWTLGSGVGLDTGRVLDEADGDVFTLAAGVTEMTVVARTSNIVNDGNYPIDNAVFTFTASATHAVLHPIILEVLGQTQIYINEDIPATKSLVVDCGQRSIKLDGADIYSSLEVQSAHKLAGWVRLSPGTTPLITTFHTGADFTLTVGFSDGHE